MCARQMHVDEVHTDVALVRGLLATQFPQWSRLPIAPVDSAGTDNAIYRLGDDMAVRLPRRPDAVRQVQKEQQWLPTLAPHLPLKIPSPVAKGIPGEGYPWDWSVYGWLEGETASRERIVDLEGAANDLAGFVMALRRIDPAGGPAPGRHNFFRGLPLVLRDSYVRAAVAALQHMFDAKAVTEAWEAALRAPEWQGAPVWIHGDLMPGNLLTVHGRLSAVIDFGGLAVGDPACDLMIAWNLLADQEREVFRSASGVDDASWARGRGWALSVALIALPYYQHTNPTITAASKHTINEVLADHAGRRRR